MLHFYAIVVCRFDLTVLSLLMTSDVPESKHEFHRSPLEKREVSTAVLTHREETELGHSLRWGRSFMCIFKSAV